MNVKNSTALEKIAIAIGITWATVTVQWLAASSFQTGLQQSESARTLVAIAFVSVGLGVFAALLGEAARKIRAASVTSVAVPLSLILFLEVLSNVRTNSGASMLLVAVAVAGFASILVVRLLFRFPVLVLRPGTWLAIAGAASTLALILSMASKTDVTGRAVAGAGSLVSIVLLLSYFLKNRRGLLIPAASLVVVVLSSVVLATRIPVHEPDKAMRVARPSILLITVDTLRADHVGAYGYANARTDHMDALAAEGVAFLETVSANVFTGPSHTSILTGLVPETHGVLVNRMRLSDGIPTLADLLRPEGYSTAAFVSGYTTQDASWGIPSRFDVYDDDIRAFQWLPQVAYRVAAMRIVKETSDVMGWYSGDIGQSYRMGGDTADRVIDWIDVHTGRPFFVWTHFFDPHVPYRPPAQYIQPQLNPESPVTGAWYALKAKERSDIATSPASVAEMIALYDAEVAYVDVQIGRILEAARRAAPDGNLLIIVTSDHGESMGEHGIFWDRDLYDDTLMVPLIVVPPASDSATARREVETQVRLIDIAPTVLDLLGIETSAHLDGVSLADLLHGEPEAEPEPATSSLYVAASEFARERHSVRHRGWKLIRKEPGWESRSSSAVLKQVSEELYDLQADPLELTNLIESEEPVYESLAGTLEARASGEDSPDLHLSPEERRRLQSLGYLQ